MQQIPCSSLQSSLWLVTVLSNTEQDMLAYLLEYVYEKEQQKCIKSSLMLCFTAV